MLTSQSGPAVSRSFGQLVEVGKDIDVDEARRLVEAGSAELVSGRLGPAPEVASVAPPENAAKRTGSAPRRRGRPRKKKE